MKQLFVHLSTVDFRFFTQSKRLASRVVTLVVATNSHHPTRDIHTQRRNVEGAVEQYPLVGVPPLTSCACLCPTIIRVTTIVASLIVPLKNTPTRYAITNAYFDESGHYRRLALRLVAHVDSRDVAR